jgi:hypothetical protein
MDDTSTYCVHLVLRGCRAEGLVQDEEDWRALSMIAERMLFWCGGSIHGCRCEGNEMHFAVEPAHASMGAMVSHLSGAYTVHLRRRRGWTGDVFRHYRATALDAELYLDDLVIWLHRPAEPKHPGNAPATLCWTADAAYRTLGSLKWITTRRVLDALGGSGLTAYRRRLAQPMAPDIVAMLGPPAKGRRYSRTDRANSEAPPAAARDRRKFERIARMVARHSHIEYEDMRSQSRKRAIVKAKVIAAVLSTRNGASAAAIARLFRRSRSTLIEQVEHYRETQPQLFSDAEHALADLDQEFSRPRPTNEEGMEP